jgi:hypothetical protein
MDETRISSMSTSVCGPPNVDRVCAWQEELRRAVRESDALPPAACQALARLLEQFLEEEAADADSQGELRAALARLNAASQRNRSSTG